MPPPRKYSWEDAYVAAFRAVDPADQLAKLEHALVAFQKRLAEWRSSPGTLDEIRDIRRAIAQLKGHLEERGTKTA